MSHDPGFKFRKFLSFAQFCMKLAQEYKRYRQKNKLGTPPPPSAYRVVV